MKTNLSTWESNCNETWVGNMHAWREVMPNPLPWYKKLIGCVMQRCYKCQRERIMIDTLEPIL